MSTAKDHGVVESGLTKVLRGAMLLLWSATAAIFYHLTRKTCEQEEQPLDKGPGDGP